MYAHNHAWAYMCVYGNINTHITHMYAFIYVFINVCMRVYMDMCAYMLYKCIVRYVYRQTGIYYIQVYVCMHIGINVCRQTCMGIHVYLCP